MKVQITNGMFMALLINMVYAKAIGLTQGSMAREVGNDIWISTIFSTFQGILMIYLLVLIIRRLPNHDVFQHSEILAGKIFGKMVCLLVFIFFLGAFGTIMATFVYHIKDFFLPDAPILLVVVVPFILGVYAIHYGIEVIARMALVGVFSILSLNLLILLGSLSELDIRELLPVFEFGVGRTIWASRHHNTDWAMAFMMAAIILPIVKQQEKWGRAGVAGIVYGGLFIVLWPILEVGVLSAEVTAQYIVSCMQMARSAEIGYFIHRYEMIMIAFFAISILTQVMMTFLCASISIQRLFSLKDYRPVIIPVCLVLTGYSYWFVFDHQRAIKIIETYWVALSMGIAIGLLLLLYILGFIFKKKVKANNKKHPSFR